MHKSVGRGFASNFRSIGDRNLPFKKTRTVQYRDSFCLVNSRRMFKRELSISMDGLKVRSKPVEKASDAQQTVHIVESEEVNATPFAIF